MRPGEQYRPAAWRLIVDGEADGATNMAVDEAILQTVVAGTSPPTLRFYGWAPPCLSLGRNQPAAEADRAACQAAGVDLVRRPTGGRAILHTDELTYALALRQDDPRATGDVMASYRRLSEGLRAGLQRLGVAAVQAVGQQPPNAGQHAVCFETPSNYEIVVAGRKLVGSAQWRSRGGVLQHGSLPLHGELTRVVDYLAFGDEERAVRRRSLRDRALTLEETTGRVLPFSVVAEALAAGFAEALNLTLASGALTDQERTLAAQLRRERYADPGWTARA